MLSRDRNPLESEASEGNMDLSLTRMGVYLKIFECSQSILHLIQNLCPTYSHFVSYLKKKTQIVRKNELLLVFH